MPPVQHPRKKLAALCSLLCIPAFLALHSAPALAGTLEEVTTAPAVQTSSNFTIQQGTSLESTLSRWTQQTGWALAWKIPPTTPDIIFDINYTLPPANSTSLITAVEFLFKTLNLSSTFKAHFYTGNNTLVVTP